MPRTYDPQPYESNGAARVLKGVAAGLVGGLVASWTMSQSQTVMSNVTAQLGNGNDSSDSSSGDQGASESSGPATAKAADRLSQSVWGRELDDSEKARAGQAMHYLVGAVTGAVYGGLVAWQPRLAMGAGLPYGAAVWAIADEIAVPAAGLSKPPTEHPPSTHLYALGSHLVYGLTLEAVRRALVGRPRTI